MKTNVTQPLLPELDNYIAQLREIWARKWLTNFGPVACQLENELCQYLNVKNLSFVTNGTIALQLAIRALGLSGKIITTPFSFIATASSIVWEHCEPLFADIDSETLTLDPAAAERAIGPGVTGILATHVYGNPCDVEAFDRLAQAYKIRVIYDAAHAFGVRYRGESILNYGDCSTLSFHATKLFHTVEGGAIVCKSQDTVEKIHHMRNFGLTGPTDYDGVGINAKNSEVHAAMGICVLPLVRREIEYRKKLTRLYDLNLTCHAELRRPVIRPGTEYNFSYYPILFSSEAALMRAYARLNENNVFPRRYFYPSLNTISYLRGVTLPVSEHAAGRVLCLPLHSGLTEDAVLQISDIIKKSLEQA